MVDKFARQLSDLLSGRQIPVSQFSKRNTKRLQTLLETGVLEEVRSGGGRSYVPCHRDALERFALKEYPTGLEVLAEPGGTPRSQAVATYRDAKKAGSTDAEVVQLRIGSNENSKILYRNGEALPISEWCKVADVAAIRLDADYQWSASATIAIVENLEVFLHFEKLQFPTDLILYAGGKLSGRVLDWLASPGMQECRIIHFGDYDPVGVDEYLRLKQRCPGRVKMFVPENIETLFNRFGKQELLVGNEAVLGRLRSDKDELTVFLISLMDSCQCGLEQEVLLIHAP